MITGFTIGGFRNFANPPKWVAPLGRINIFLGSNNSGKSNVLRYINRVLVPSISPGGTKGLSGIDKNEGKPGPPLVQISTAYDPKDIAGTLRHKLPEQNITAGLDAFLSDDRLSLISSFVFPRSEQKLFPLASIPPDKKYDNRSIHDFWSSISGTSGGGFAEHWYPQVAEWVSRYIITDRSCHYINAFRFISTRLAEFESEYQKDPRTARHLIDELADIERPGWDNQDRKADFIKLEKFLQTLLENTNIRVEISSDRSHIIVHDGEKAIPLEALGSGIHEVFLLAAEVVLRDDDIVLIEEPETHLHPALQRKLMYFLTNNTKSQIYITTHSSAIIDTPGAHVFGVTGDAHGARIEPLLTSHDRFNSCRNLGYKASDLLQSNCIIWVEGPSDRMYLAKWIKDTDDALIEGIHYSIMFYGGRLLSHLEAIDESLNELINLLPINRRCAMVIDSDRGAANQPIRSTKERLIAEITSIGGFTWLTSGREIENYYNSNSRDRAIRSVHTNVSETNVGGNRFSKPLWYRGSDQKERTADKIAIAEWLTANEDPSWDDLLLGESLNNIVRFIRSSNA